MNNCLICKHRCTIRGRMKRGRARRCGGGMDYATPPGSRNYVRHICAKGLTERECQERGGYEPVSAKEIGLSTLDEFIKVV